MSKDYYYESKGTWTYSSTSIDSPIVTDTYIYIDLTEPIHFGWGMFIPTVAEAPKKANPLNLPLIDEE